MPNTEVTQEELVSAIQTVMRLRAKEFEVLRNLSPSTECLGDIAADVDEKRAMLMQVAEYLQGCLDDVVQTT